jgi:hypothetical protein
MSFHAFLDSIVSGDLRRIADNWLAARGTRFMPAWRDFDPVPIGPQLRYIWAWKYDRAAQIFTGRLAGEDITGMFGGSVHGVPMTDYFPPDIYRVFFPWMQRVVVEPVFARGAGLIYRRLGRNFTGERIILPLADDGMNGDGLIGATFYNPVTAGIHQDGPHLTGEEQVDFFALDGAVADAARA